MADIRPLSGSDSGMEDESEEPFVEETIMERLWGLTEMVPDKYWKVSKKYAKKGYSFVKSSTWILVTTLALTILPPVIEMQRGDLEEAQKQQSKQLLFGEGSNQPAQPGMVPSPPVS